MSKAFRRSSLVLALAFLVALASVPALAEETAAEGTLSVNDYQAPQLRADCKAPFQLPSSARRALGDTILHFQAIILKDGTVGQVELLNNDKPYPGIEQAARDSFRNWRYEPGTLSGVAVDAGVIVSVQFQGAAAASMTRPAYQWTPRTENADLAGLKGVIFTGIFSDGYQPLSLEDSGPFNTPRPECQFKAGPRCGYMFSGGRTTLSEAHETSSR